MVSAEPLILAGGALVVLLGLADAFLTILHPDVDGPITRAVNRVIWRIAAAWARAWPGRRRETLGYAGPAMILADIVAWITILIVGYALMLWPFLDRFSSTVGTGTGFADALYFSGVTFTTLGYGDIVPLAPPWQLLSVAEALTGFVVMTTSIAHVIAVFGGIDHRDAAALRIYSETAGTWDGHEFLARSFGHEGADVLRERVRGWAGLVRELHGKLYRFHGLAFYLRTQGIRHGPERMMYALAETALAARLLPRWRELRTLGPAAEDLAIAFDHFAFAIARRQGSRAKLALMGSPTVTGEDAARLRRVQEDLAARLGLAALDLDPAEDAALLQAAARTRAFLSLVDELTLWREIQGPDASTA